MQDVQQLPEQRSLGELFSRLAHQTSTLVSKEVELARTEMTTKAKIAGRDAALVAGGASIAALGAMALLGALILLLATAIPLWTSALVVGLTVGLTGGVLFVLGIRSFKRLDAAPRQTIQTLQEDRRWLKEQASR
jgi:hypothetical protein